MKYIHTLALLFFVFQSCKDSLPTNRNVSSAKISAEKTTKTPHDFMFMQRAYPSGELKPNAIKDAAAWKRNELSKRNSLSEVWEFVGPVNTGGRITDIEIPVNDSNTYYVGAASGGIFKTINAGVTFNPIFDDQDMLSIGDIEISKTNPNTLWVGTGEVNAGGGSLTYDGDGIYKSENGGLSWESKGLPNVGSIGKILIHPSNEDIIFVGAMGPLFKNDENRGVYKTIDGGVTWEKVFQYSNRAGVIDMAIHPTDGNIVYAAFWQRERTTENRIYGGADSGLWRSQDGGTTWSLMTNGLPTIATQKGRISIDISQSNPNVLYARYANAAGGIQGVYRTQDGGDSWQTMNSSALTDVGFHWWFRGIFVDPENENIIYNVDFEVQKSIDGGQTWSDVFSIAHVDQHAMAFTTQGASTILLGNDGGLYTSANEGASSSKIETLPITQFYRVHVDAQNDDKIYVGSQDNSTVRTTTSGTNDWSTIFGGDGFQPLVDPTNTNVIYALSQNGNLGKSINNGASFNGALNGIPNIDRNNWDTPITFDPADSQTLYYGTNKLYKTTNAAGSWTAISPDLTNGPSSGNLTFGTIISISISPLNSEVIYVGTDDGNVWVTQDAGSNWLNISSTLPNRWVTKVLADRENANGVYVTFSGYRFGENEGHVYQSSDFGANWNNISTGIPDIPINDIIKDINDILYVGTDIGVIASGDNGQTWVPLAANLPSVPVTDMHIHEVSQYLYIGTYGRSIYKINLSNDILAFSENEAENTLIVSPNPANDYITLTLGKSIGSKNEIQLHDALGRLVASEILNFGNSNQATLNLSQYPTGVYFLSVATEGKTITKKLIKN
ncbi:hypothetical protein ULMS_10780 [Patiriisocius marinistellae]|uniref:Secretion system C-terminal sorting domain-containing protein n=1 Tax=Patiriisocius marinistellae TaxID=2494560 RepID=A0A5J4FUL0_9FLAO|nr:T9SS type A sorting domain-containing protein [Patiriisocius marinistellae]GEQ85570.1 hypothetical protein ULMS_10780 [Patiriisocius marinistellae]